MFGKIIDKLRWIKHEHYIRSCVKNGMKIGKNTNIMPGCYFDSHYSFLISIGDNCTLSNRIFILAHDASMYKLLGFGKVAKVVIHDNCFVGAGSIILPGVSIGPNAVVGAGSVVVKDVPPNSVAGGNPAKLIKSIDEFKQSYIEKFKNNKFLWLEDFLKKHPLIEEPKYLVKTEDRELIEKY